MACSTWSPSIKNIKRLQKCTAEIHMKKLPDHDTDDQGENDLCASCDKGNLSVKSFPKM